MKAYILAVAGAILLSAALSVLLPEGKTGKFIRGMMQLAVLSIVTAPLIGLLSKRELALTAGEAEPDESYLVSCAELLAEEDEREIGRLLREEFSLDAEAEVTRGTGAGFPLQKIVVKISCGGIIGQEPHIDMTERIGAALRGKYGCETEVLWT